MASPRPSAGPVFKTVDRETAFFAAYDAVLDQWPVSHRAVDIPSPYGTTRVNACGPEDGTPLVLLPGGGATSTVWFANVAALSRAHRVYAVDLMGDAGRSVHDGRPITVLDDLMDWLDGVFGHLGLDSADLLGHSYGGSIALHYALRSPQRVRRLVLLDPNQCFTGMKAGYLLHALPLLVRPTAERMRALIAWETGGAPVDPAWLKLVCLGAADFPRSKVVVGRRPGAERLRGCTVPTLVLLAGDSRVHDIRRVSANAREAMPEVTTAVLPGVSHHAMPTGKSTQLDRHVVEFLS
jgi:pimeloyl-ACP methyl ester carboxylesterase